LELLLGIKKLENYLLESQLNMYPAWGNNYLLGKGAFGSVLGSKWMGMLCAKKIFQGGLVTYVASTYDEELSLRLNGISTKGLDLLLQESCEPDNCCSRFSTDIGASPSTSLFSSSVLPFPNFVSEVPKQ